MKIVPYSWVPSFYDGVHTTEPPAVFAQQNLSARTFPHHKDTTLLLASNWVVDGKSQGESKALLDDCLQQQRHQHGSLEFTHV